MPQIRMERQEKVKILTKMHEPKSEKIGTIRRKPVVVPEDVGDYCLNMNAVDRADQ